MVTSSDEAELLTGDSEGMNITKIKAITGYKESTRTKTLKSGRTKETKVLRTSPGGQWIRVSYSDASGVAGHLDVTRREYDAAASILRLIHDGRAVGADSSLDSRLSPSTSLTHSPTRAALCSFARSSRSCSVRVRIPLGVRWRCSSGCASGASCRLRRPFARWSGP